MWYFSENDGLDNKINKLYETYKNIFKHLYSYFKFFKLKQTKWTSFEVLQGVLFVLSLLDGKSTGMEYHAIIIV